MTLESYSSGLEKCEANYSALTPISFLQRTAAVFPNYTSILSQHATYTWQQTYERCKMFACALTKTGIKKGDNVSIIAPNTSAMYEAHFAIPMAGAVINTINTRLDAQSISYILSHSDAKLLFVDSEYIDLIEQAFKIGTHQIPIVYIEDHPDYPINSSSCLSYEDFLIQGKENSEFFQWQLEDEWFPISLSYTSGTTGKPKGVVTHHRGAYLNAIGNHLVWHMSNNPIYLWTLPMFHCNGWCFPWTIAALAGTNICLRNINANSILAAINTHKVTHLCGAPIILNMLIEAGIEIGRKVEIMTAAAPPPASVLKKIQNIGFNITHVYGLTEVYGPAIVCEWQQQWSQYSEAKIAELKSRQGVNYPGLKAVQIFKEQTTDCVAADGIELGEVCMQGNIVMMGYYKDQPATQQAFENGWFRTGDLGVMHDDGYLQLKDRSKDIIISGGENISTIEIENILFQHPEVLDAAVVAKLDDKWGEVPCAFISLSEHSKTTEQEIIDFCRANMPHFKAPKVVIFGEIDKTSTGKTQKFLLRERANKER